MGDVGVGGDNPIRVQSMTTTDTQDTDATARQVSIFLRARSFLSLCQTFLRNWLTA